MLKVAVFGGGSTYTPELVKGFLDRHASFPLDELWLEDIDGERLEIVGGFAQRMVEAQGSPFKVVLTQNPTDAVKDADYVTTQLRVGQMPARVADEYLGRRHGLIGQETTGVGGMAKALRTIPVILNIAREMQAHAKPGAMLVNFTNPSGLVTEALFRHAPQVPSVGLCNVAIHTKMEILEQFEKLTGSPIDPRRAELKTLGLNHLTWHTGFTLDGEDIWDQVFAAFLEQVRDSSEPEWDFATLEDLRMIPNYYLQFYYYTARKLAEQTQWPPSRGEEVIEIEKDLLRQYAVPNLHQPPKDLMKRGGAYYSTTATQLLNAHYNNLGETHVCSTRQAGAVNGWDKDWVLEMPCRVDAKGIHPLPADPLPLVCQALISHVKAYELLTVEAAVTGDRKALYEALLAHPLGPAADQAQAVMENLLKTNKAYLPQFE